MRLQDVVGIYLVSTVELSSVFGLYETMIFRVVDGEINYLDLYCERTWSENEARDAHEWACALASNGHIPNGTKESEK